MKNKKGFTLIEIIITIALISVVSIMFTNSFNSIQRNTQKKDYQRMVTKIKNAVTVYAENNASINSELYAGKGYILVTIGDLVKSGILSNEMTDPSTQSPINQSNVVYAYIDQYGLMYIDYPHKNSGTNECYLETVPYVTAKNTSITNTLLFININAIGLRLMKTDGSLVALATNSSIIVTKQNIIANTVGTYTVEYKYKDCNNTNIWRLGTRKIIFI